MTTFPETLTALAEELRKHSKDGRSDALFRHAIVIDQIGALVRHLTHDCIENPTSRPHGGKKSETDAAGHAMVQLMTYVILRDVDLQEAVNSALINLREKDFIARKARLPGKVEGVVACIGTGTIQAKAWVCHGDKMQWPDAKWEPLVLVIGHAEADARLKQFQGIVQDHGGMHCHAAIISRESGIPCIVGTGNATEEIQTGDLIQLNTANGSVTIIKG